MSSKRRPRGTRIDPVAPGYVIERTAKDRLAAIARKANTSPSVILEQIIERLQLTDQGLPEWWAPLPRDQELPIDTD